MHELLDAATLEAASRDRRPVLSAAQVAQAHQLITEGISLSQLARAFGTTRATVYRALARENGGTYGGVRAEVAAMKAELEQLRDWHAQFDQMSAPAATGEQVVGP